jgi:hypothetical protein
LVCFSEFWLNWYTSGGHSSLQCYNFDEKSWWNGPFRVKNDPLSMSMRSLRYHIRMLIMASGAQDDLLLETVSSISEVSFMEA